MSLIYEPRGRAREYAALACNIYRGCDHGCTYCYAPRVTHNNRFVESQARQNFLQKLNKNAKKHRRTDKRVLLCFTTDPYQRLDVKLEITRRAIEILHQHDIPVQVLTKGGSRALRDLDLFTNRDMFAATMTFIDEQDSLKWEPNAATPDDRMKTLRKFSEAGVATWVSLEPVIDPQQSLEVIRVTNEFVDMYKVGKLNHHPLANKIDWKAFAIEAVELLERRGKTYYVKHDLRKYLPSSLQHVGKISTDIAPKIEDQIMFSGF